MYDTHMSTPGPKHFLLICIKRINGLLTAFSYIKLDEISLLYYFFYFFSRILMPADTVHFFYTLNWLWKQSEIPVLKYIVPAKWINKSIGHMTHWNSVSRKWPGNVTEVVNLWSGALTCSMPLANNWLFRSL